MHDKLGLDFSKTNKCVEDSFISSSHQSSENTILRDEQAYKEKYGPSFFPAVVVNNVTYRGTLEPTGVYTAICEGFQNKPTECGALSPMPAEGITTSTLLMIIFGLVVLNVGIIICYKKYAKKEMDDKIEMHINSAVSQYFALQDKNNKTVKPLIN